MNGKRKDLMMSIAMCLLVVFALYQFLVKPQRAQLASVRAERMNLEQTLTQVQSDLVTTGSVAPVDAASSPGAVEVPIEAGLADLLRLLQTIGQDTGMVQQSVSPSSLGANPSGVGGSLQITISASGPHSAVAMYLQRIRDLERLMVIEQVGVESPGGGSVDQVQLVLRAFTQQAPSQTDVAAT
jgi:Tfp pilus assembly protein PilO